MDGFNTPTLQLAHTANGHGMNLQILNGGDAQIQTYAGTALSLYDSNTFNVVSNGVLAIRVDGAGNTGIGMGNSITLPHPISFGSSGAGVDGSGLYYGVLYTPAASSTTCTAGEWAEDANYFYVCVAPNTWKSLPFTPFQQLQADANGNLTTTAAITAGQLFGPNFHLDASGNIYAAGGAFSEIAGTVKALSYHEALTTPASSSAACTAGDFTDDANFHYVCVASATWKRVALTSF